MDTCAYLLKKYPQVFVEAVITGATCDIDDHWESFPLLDAMNGRVEMAATIYATTLAFENMQAIRDFAAVEQARHRWEKAARALTRMAAAKEGERAQAERAAKREGRRDQPWRKGHA